ncbi:alpha-S2-casein-like [Orycteropus afer afer]|uniref:Alpha-S2-casein-like n=1 Tax=Orycteropus afer afer TaxID=1230840 RepID=A0A8B7A4B6_ORYAF|nr:alpha-S2-casein-like [Orycteropus afer afer]
MKFFIFTCLLAVALAEHKMEPRSSSEESVSISQERSKQYKNVVIHPREETIKMMADKETSSSSSSEESAEVFTQKTELTEEEKNFLKELNKINQFYQKLSLLQYPQAFLQHHTVMSPENHIRRVAYPFIPTVVSTAFLFNHFQGKTVDLNLRSMDKFQKKIELTKKEENYLRQLNKANQHHRKFTIPHSLKAVPQYQTARIPWNHIKTNAYQYIPIQLLLLDLGLDNPSSIQLSYPSHHFTQRVCLDRLIENIPILSQKKTAEIPCIVYTFPVSS